MKTKDILTFYLGLVFIFASLHRIGLFENRTREVNEHMQLPPFSDMFIILFEFTVGVLLITNHTYKYHALCLLLIFLIIGSFLIAFYNMDTLLATYNEIWTYQPTSMSFVLHLAYIVMIAAILWEVRTMKGDK